MNTSKVIILGLGAAALLGVAYYTAREEEKVVQSAAAPTAKVQESITSGTIARIEIQTPDSTAPIVLTRKGEDWYTNVEKGYRADKNQLTGVLTSMEKDLEGEIVSTNPDSYPDFQVDEKSGTRVRFYAAEGKPLTDLIVGKEGAAAFTTYVRKADGKEVVNANQQLSMLFKKRADDWRDKVLFEFNQDTITAIASEGTSGTVSLAKTGDTWKVTAPQSYEAQQPKVSSLLSTLGNLRATEFEELETTGALAERGLDPPRQKLTISHEDRSTSPAKTVQSVLLIGSQRGNAPGNPYYVRRSDQRDVALINEYQAKTLSPELSEIAVLPPPPPQPETTGTQTETTATQPAAAETTGTEVSQSPASSDASPAPAAAATPTPTPATPASSQAEGEKASSPPAAVADGPSSSPAVAVPPVTPNTPAPAVTPSVKDDQNTYSDTLETTGATSARQ